MLITIPEAYATKIQNQWMSEVWIAAEIFTSKLNGTRKKNIKDLFLRYIRNLQEKGKIQEQVLFPLQSEFNPNRLMLINISDLNSERLVKPFVIFEVLQLNFVE